MEKLLHANVLRNQFRSLFPVDMTHARPQQGFDLLPSLNLGSWQPPPFFLKAFCLTLPNTLPVCVEFSVRILSMCRAYGGQSDKADYDKL
jgi:hypothetical protein